MAIAIFVISFFVLMLIGVPIAFSLGATSILTGVVLWGFAGIPLETFAQRAVAGVNSFTTLAIPLFLICGKLMNRGNITKKIFDLAQDLVGRFHGGLGYVNILASVVFAGMSGSAPADAAGLGQIEIQAMTENGFDNEFSGAVTGCSALISPIIPPSISMVMYGVLAGTSVSSLFMGGVIPGALMAVAMGVVVWYYSKKRNYPRSDPPTLKKIVEDLRYAILPLLAPIIIVGGIWSGLFTASESAAVAVVYMIILCVFVYRSMSLKDIWVLFRECLVDCASILMIMSSVSIYSYVLNLTNVPKILATSILNLTSNPTIIMLLLAGFLLIIGCFMSTLQSIILFTPIFLPLLQSAGVNLLVFGVVMCITLAVGQMTPPFGTVMFITARVANISIDQLVKNSIPFLLAVIVVILLCIFVQPLVTFLPTAFT